MTFFQYSLHYKRENAHDDAMWSVAWGHRDRTEEEVVVEAPPEKDSNGENKENQDGETPATSETPGWSHWSFDIHSSQFSRILKKSYN